MDKVGDAIMTNFIDYIFKNLKDSSIRCLNLNIILMVIGSRKEMLDMKFVTKLMNILIFERVTIIRDNRWRDNVATNDVVKDKISDLLSCDVGKGYGFNLVCVVLSGGDNKLVSIRRGGMDLSYEVESPLRERLRCCNRMKLLH